MTPAGGKKASGSAEFPRILKALKPFGCTVGRALSSPRRQRSHTLAEISGIMQNQVTSLQLHLDLI